MATTRDCGGNPINYTDPTGHSGEALTWWSGSMWWLGAVDGPIPAGDAVYGLGILVLGGAAIYKGSKSNKLKENAVSKTKVVVPTAPLAKAVNDSLSKAKKKPKNNRRAKHHMVAKAAKAAAPARDILTGVGYGVNSKVNLVSIKQSLHLFLHTKVYYRAVNDMMRPAKGSKQKVTVVLNVIRSILQMASAKAP